jgi:tetratricopeptide (TPR) repeat protein
MALFGAPVAHEDHARRACHAALAIQDALRGFAEDIKSRTGANFAMRVGLNSGAVVVGAIGDDLRMDYTAIGDTTNLASRLEHLAEPGTVLLSDNTFKLVREFFDFESVGGLQVKGKQQIHQAYRLIRPTHVETRIQAASARGLTRFVGRKQEIGMLMDAFEKTCSGQGQVIGVVGDAGVGKSRLVYEFKNMLPEGGFAFLEGRCLHYGGSMPYLPVLDILRTYLGIEDTDREQDIRKKIDEKLESLGERLESVLPPIHDLLSLKVDDPKYLQLDPPQKKIRAFEGLRDVLMQASESRPLVIAVEDLHWIDKTSEEFLGYLIDSISSARVLLVLLYRPEYTHRWGSKSYYGKLGVNQLSASSSMELVRAVLEDGDIAPELTDLVTGRSGGNPLFVEELTHSLLENGAIERRDQRYVLTRDATGTSIPDTVQTVIAARIDRIEENLKRVLLMASVIGREFAFRILQRVMEMRDDLKSNLLNLQGLEFISEKRLFPELEYVFKHALTQEVAYNSLLQKKRKKIHGKIGEAIELIYPDRIEEYFELLAYHYARSENINKAIDYLDRANQKSAKLNAIEEAKVFFDEAMKLLDDQPETDLFQQRRISLLVNQWIVFWLLFRVPEYFKLLKAYEPISLKVSCPQMLATFYARLGMCEWVSGSLEQSITTLTTAKEICEDPENIEEVSFRNMYLIWNLLYKGDYDQATALTDIIIRLMKQQFNLRTYTWSLCGISWAYSCLSRYDDALNIAHKTLQVSEEYSNNGMISFAAWIISIPHLYKGKYDLSLEYADLAVQSAPTVAEKVWAQTFLGWSLCRAGETIKGVELLASLVPMYRFTGFLPGEIIVTLHLCEGYFLSGEYEKARQTLEEVLPVTEGCEMKLYIAWAHRLLGEIALKDDFRRAEAHFEKSTQIYKRINSDNELALAYSGYGRLYKQQGNTDKAREYLTMALEIFERLGTFIEPDKVKKELNEL